MSIFAPKNHLSSLTRSSIEAVLGRVPNDFAVKIALRLCRLGERELAQDMITELRQCCRIVKLVEFGMEGIYVPGAENDDVDEDTDRKSDEMEDDEFDEMVAVTMVVNDFNDDECDEDEVEVDEVGDDDLENPEDGEADEHMDQIEVVDVDSGEDEDEEVDENEDMDGDIDEEDNETDEGLEPDEVDSLEEGESDIDADEDDTSPEIDDTPKANTPKALTFAAALAMIAGLPLTDAERADAIRMLMGEKSSKTD